MLSFLKNAKAKKFDDYWVQVVNVKNILHREDLFFPLCKNKRVIHFGCTDWPIFNPKNNLHIKLDKVANILHGFDIDLIGIENLKQFVNQPYFSRFEELINYEYDVCLIPETIEHVDNVSTFLQNLKFVNAKTFLITAPNCFAQNHMERNIHNKNTFSEIVHPDHNCWYSPYTLKNVIEKYSPLKVDQVFLLEGGLMVCCEATFK